MMKHHGKGNRKAQVQRHRERRKHRPPKVENMVILIDGNPSYYPVAFCKTHGAYLTEGLVNTHRCEQRHCKGFELMYEGGDA